MFYYEAGRVVAPIAHQYAGADETDYGQDDWADVADDEVDVGKLLQEGLIPLERRLKLQLARLNQPLYVWHFLLYRIFLVYNLN